MNFHALIYSHLWIILNNSTPLSRTLNRCDRATFHTSRITTTPTTILYPNISSWLLLSFYKPCNGRKDSVPTLHIRLVSSRVPSWNPYIFCIRLEDSGDSNLLRGYGIDKNCKLLLFLCTFWYVHQSLTIEGFLPFSEISLSFWGLSGKISR